MNRKSKKIINYTERFEKLKTLLLAFKWDMDVEVADDETRIRLIRRRLAKIAALLFDIERDFEYINKKRKY